MDWDFLENLYDEEEDEEEEEEGEPQIISDNNTFWGNIS